jgi:aspartate aminotransferase-like enzyme
MRKHRLYSPGPTPIPPEVLVAMSKPIDYHRSEDFRSVLRETAELLQYAFQTERDVALLTASGTGAMECALVNLFSPGDEVIGVRSGKFGERWAEMANALGLRFHPLDVEWGGSVSPALVEQALGEHPGAKGVLTTLCETSTGALHDIRAIGELLRERDALLVTDAVSALGADEMHMDAWGVDALVSASQKGLMTPPGLAFCAFSERAERVAATARLPRYYFDLQRAVQDLARNETPFTPAVSLVYGLRQALGMIRDEGIEQVWARHSRMARATREGAKALGLSVFPARPANTVTAVRLPERVDGRAVLRVLRRDHGVVFVGGQDRLSGRIVRIAHLGWMDDYDALVAVAALERGLRESGLSVPLGAGVAAAQGELASR